MRCAANINATNEYQQTALMLAVKNGHHQVAEVMIERFGAAVDRQDDLGMTALHLAAYTGHEALVQILLEQGASAVLWDEFYFTPIHYAAYRGHPVVVKRIAEYLNVMYRVGVDLFIPEGEALPRLPRASFPSDKNKHTTKDEKDRDNAEGLAREGSAKTLP